MLPLSTTTISIQRYPTLDSEGDDLDPYATEDPYTDAPITPYLVISGVNAWIGAGAGTPVWGEGANRMELHQQLKADPCDLQPNDLVVDESNGQTFRVEGVDFESGLGLDHVSASLILGS